MEPSDDGPTVESIGLDRSPSLPIGEDEAALVEGGQRSSPSLLLHGRTDADCCTTDVTEVRTGERAMDGTQEERGVELIDEHGEACLPWRPRVLLLQSQVGGISVMTVRQQAMSVLELAVDHRQVRRLTDCPDALAVTSTVQIVPVGSVQRETVEELSECCVAVMDQKDGRRVQTHVKHAIC